MDSAENGGPSGNEFYILKQGTILGPYTREELRDGLEQGALDVADFVQVGGLPIWQPLGRLLDGQEGESHGAVAPDWRSLLTWVWLRLRYDLDEQSVMAGSICLAIGLVSLALSSWTFLFWMPWMVAALLAGLALCQRRRLIAGILMLLAVIVLPLVILSARSSL